MSHRAVWVGASIAWALLVSVTATAAAPQAAPGTAKSFRVALSVGPFTPYVFESAKRAGKVRIFTDGKRTATDAASLQRLYKAHGATEVFARASTRNARNTRGIADHSLDAALATGTLARKLGLRFNLELGLFRTYGDLLCQTPPDFSDYSEVTAAIPAGKAWHDLTLDQMTTALTTYGAVVARRLESAGVRVSMWDIGNEIDFGFAGVSVQPARGACNGDEGVGPGDPPWYRPPDAVNPAIGRKSLAELSVAPQAQTISWLRTNLWPHEAKLLVAVQRGIRSVDGGAVFSTHLSGAASEAFAVAFYDTMRANGVALKEIGLSYYPTSNGASFNTFKRMVTTLEKRFGRKVFVAEFAYAAEEFRTGSAGGPFGMWARPVSGYPISEAGAARFLRDLTSWGAVNGISGIRPWAPDLAQVPPAGDLWEPLALFNGVKGIGGTARARPGLDSMSKGLGRR